MLCSLFSFLSKRIIEPTPRGSRPLVGSSNKIIPGAIARTPAMAARLFWPKLRVWIAFSDVSDMPIIFKASVVLRATSSGFNPRLTTPKATSCLTVEAKSWSLGSWKTIPTCLNISSPLRRRNSLPFRQTLPADGFNNPFKCFNRVVLPQPLAPIRAKNSPSITSRLTSHSA